MSTRTVRASNVWLPLVLLVARAATVLTAQVGTPPGEWRSWGADGGTSHYSPLDQISRDNVATLRLAWR
jgi:glucose dehydrogenase